jgi:hypothetical protein
VPKRRKKHATQLRHKPRPLLVGLLALLHHFFHYNNERHLQSTIVPWYYRIVMSDCADFWFCASVSAKEEQHFASCRQRRSSELFFPSLHVSGPAIQQFQRRS